MSELINVVRRNHDVMGTHHDRYLSMHEARDQMRTDAMLALERCTDRHIDNYGYESIILMEQPDRRGYVVGLVVLNEPFRALWSTWITDLTAPETGI